MLLNALQTDAASIALELIVLLDAPGMTAGQIAKESSVLLIVRAKAAAAVALERSVLLDAPGTTAGVIALETNAQEVAPAIGVVQTACISM